VESTESLDVGGVALGWLRLLKGLKEPVLLSLLL
jgi:hypothetical protein